VKFFSPFVQEVFRKWGNYFSVKNFGKYFTLLPPSILSVLLLSLLFHPFLLSLLSLSVLSLLSLLSFLSFFLPPPPLPLCSFPQPLIKVVSEIKYETLIKKEKYDYVPYETPKKKEKGEKNNHVPYETLKKEKGEKNNHVFYEPPIKKEKEKNHVIQEREQRKKESEKKRGAPKNSEILETPKKSGAPEKNSFGSPGKGIPGTPKIFKLEDSETSSEFREPEDSDGEG
jgi:hypothetical protein